MESRKRKEFNCEEYLSKTRSQRKREARYGEWVFDYLTKFAGCSSEDERKEDREPHDK